MKIGLFGGTYNPVHIGHLRTAREVQEAFSLDRIYLIPSAVPPHKKNTGLADAKDRLEMLRLALDEYAADFSVSEVEVERSGPSYTVDTVHQFQENFPDSSRFFLVVGLDAFLEIDTWKSYEELFRCIPMIVLGRPVEGACGKAERRERFTSYVLDRISGDYRWSDTDRVYRHPVWQPIHLFDGTTLDISSTRIREMAGAGRSIQFLVPEKVRKYIDTRGLYL